MVWRIFLNQIGISLFIVLLVGVVALIPLGIAIAVSHGDPQMPLFRGVFCLVQGLWMGMGITTTAIYSCTLYRVLLGGQWPWKSRIAKDATRFTACLYAHDFGPHQRHF